MLAATTLYTPSKCDVLRQCIQALASYPETSLNKLSYPVKAQPVLIFSIINMPFGTKIRSGFYTFFTIHVRIHFGRSW